MSRELLKECLDYLIEANNKTFGEYENLVDKLSTELAKPGPEPVAYCKFIDDNIVIGKVYDFAYYKKSDSHTPLYTTPPDQSAQIAELKAELAKGGVMSRELLKRCKDFMDCIDLPRPEKLYAALEAELSKPEPKPEPVAWIDKVNFEKLSDKNWNLTCYVSNTSTSTKNIPLYAAPPERKPLSNEEIEWIRIRTLGESEGPLHLNFHERFARAIEQHHGITE